MAVSAYASLLSLTRVLSRVQQLRVNGKIVLESKQIQNFQEKLESLLRFLEESHSRKLSPEMETLTRKTSLISLEAEVIVDEHIVDQLKGINKNEPSSFNQALQDVIHKLESINEEIRRHKFTEEVDYTTDPSLVKVIEKPTDFLSNPSNAIVGFEDKLHWVIDKLTNDKRTLQVIPIVGMGGLGKTTLAQSVFDHQIAQRRFDRRIWCTISQDNSLIHILQALLGEKRNEGIHELGMRLYKKLEGRRYLIVMDDMWDLNAWYRLKSYLPEDENSSGVIITTRISNIADSLRTSTDSCSLDLLDENTSWNLLKEKIFGAKSCPFELEQIGKSIARTCRGLPLSLVTIAGVLSKSEMSVTYWEYVAENVSELVSSSDDEHCLKVLSLSYQCLPIHLKPCFLYLRNFDEEERIEAKYLIRAWICEGFVKPVDNKRIEDVAEEYLKDLIDRNLILIAGRSLVGEIKQCGVHDLVREFCIKESSKENFVSIPRIMKDLGENNNSRCLICSVFISKDLGGERYCENCKMEHPFLNRLRLVDFFDTKCYTTLQYIDLSSRNLVDFPSPALHYFWILQFLMLELDEIDATFLTAIWDMPQIRHVKLFGIPFSNSRAPILCELQVLHLRELRLSKELIDRIPNLRSLTLKPKDLEVYSLHLIEFLNKLRSFTFQGQGHGYNLSKYEITFPVSLQKLSLKSIEIYWDETMTVFGSLPNLRVLKLIDVCDLSLKGWIMKEEGFPSLRVLILRNVGIQSWEAESQHLPVLGRLVIENEENLVIPSEIGNVDTLSSIHLNRCGVRTRTSAQRLLEEQNEYGNETLQVYVNGNLVQISNDDDTVF